MLFGIIRDLKQRGLGIVFITHFLEQVYQICDRITVLRNGRACRHARREGLSRQTLIAMMLGRELAQVEATAKQAVSESGPVKYRFTNFGKRGKIKPFDLEVRVGEVVGVAGLLGSGRTETAEVLFGVERADSGEARSRIGR